jgi:hypothetical protein
MSSPINQVSLIVNQLKAHVEEQIVEWKASRTAYLTKVKEVLDQPEVTTKYINRDTGNPLVFRRFSVDWYHYVHRQYGKILCQMLRHANEQGIAEIVEREAADKLAKMEVAVRKKLTGLEIHSVKKGVLRNDMNGTFSGNFIIESASDGTHVFEWESFLAGGHTVQCLHLRTKYLLKKVKG